MQELKIVTPEDLMEIHRKLDGLNEQVKLLAGLKTGREKPRLIAAREVIKLLGVSLGTWRKREPELIEAGILHPARLGRLVKYNSAEIERIVSENLIHKSQHKPRY